MQLISRKSEHIDNTWKSMFSACHRIFETIFFTSISERKPICTKTNIHMFIIRLGNRNVDFVFKTSRECYRSREQHQSEPGILPDSCWDNASCISSCLNPQIPKPSLSSQWGCWKNPPKPSLLIPIDWNRLKDFIHFSTPYHFKISYGSTSPKQ